MCSATRPENQPTSTAFDSHGGAAVVLDYWGSDIRAIQQIKAVPRILETVCGLTGMGLAAVARVTEDSWTCCAVRDGIGFGMKPGSELDLKSTICEEIRLSHQPVVIDEVAFESHSAAYRKKLHRFRSYASVPIVLRDGSFFGTLCAADSKPARFNNPEIIGAIQLFAELIASELDAAKPLAGNDAASTGKLTAQELCEHFAGALDRDLRDSLESIAASVRMFSRQSPDDESAKIVDRMRSSIDRISRQIDDELGQARSRFGEN